MRDTITMPLFQQKRTEHSYGILTYSSVKRLLDVALSFLGLTLLMIPFILVAALIYIDDPGPVFFQQQRVGRCSKHFCLYKFRTMKVNTDPNLPTSSFLNPEQYMTKLGRILRKLSIDELPQLYNVLRGDMSLVGPRPLIPEETDVHIPRQQAGVYQLRPGLTGLAQIHGRDTVSAEEKVAWDIAYLRNIGFIQDLKILIMTVPKVLKMSGVKEGSQNNMPQ